MSGPQFLPMQQRLSIAMGAEDRRAALHADPQLWRWFFRKYVWNDPKFHPIDIHPSFAGRLAYKTRRNSVGREASPHPGERAIDATPKRRAELDAMAFGDYCRTPEYAELREVAMLTYPWKEEA